MNRVRCCLPAVFTVAFSVFSPILRADVFGSWVDKNNFGFEITNMPDLDQVRTKKASHPGLPNSGKMYCVPTGTMNLFSYLGSHGYPNLMPGAGDFGPGADPLFKDLMTIHLGNMGAAMATDPNSGTSGDGQKAGVLSFLKSDPVHKADFTITFVNPTVAKPKLLSKVTKLVNAGALATLSIGWYDDFGTGEKENYRAGGHCVSLVSTASLGLFSPATISNNDPAKETSTSQYAQSSFATESYNLSDSTGHFYWKTKSGERVEVGHLEKVEGYGSGHIDGAMVLRPLEGMTLDPVTGAPTLLHPVAILGTVVPTVQSFLPGKALPITSMAMDSGDTSHPYVVRGSHSLWELDTITGVSRKVSRVPNPKQVIVAGPDRDRYVLTDNYILVFNSDGEMTSASPLPYPLDAIAYDGKNNQIVAISFRKPGRSVSRRDITYFDVTNLRPLIAFNVLGEVPFTGENPNLTVNPSDGAVYLHNDGESIIRTLPARPGSPMGLTLVRGRGNPKGLAVDDAGRFYMSDGGLIIVVDNAGIATASPFNGLPGGRFIDITHSHNNLDPRMATSPAFRNVLPPKVK